MTCRYTYDSNGNILTVSDGTNTTSYVYDSAGQLLRENNQAGTPVVAYTYDAWGNPLSCTGTLADTLGAVNPLRYRGYVYDTETGLYYLQSRYYNPETGRFLNADGYTSTGQGFVGNNMFAYCNNCPVNFADPTGEYLDYLDFLNRGGAYGGGYSGGGYSGGGGYSDRGDDSSLKKTWKFTRKIRAYFNNTDEGAALDDDFIDFYKGVPVIKVPGMGETGFSFGVVFIGTGVQDSELLKHEYGHIVHYKQIGPLDYFQKVAVPSVANFWLNGDNEYYYAQPWEYVADKLGGVDISRRKHLPMTKEEGFVYYIWTLVS